MLFSSHLENSIAYFSLANSRPEFFFSGFLRTYRARSLSLGQFLPSRITATSSRRTASRAKELMRLVNHARTSAPARLVTHYAGACLRLLIICHFRVSPLPRRVCIKLSRTRSFAARARTCVSYDCCASCRCSFVIRVFFQALALQLRCCECGCRGA